MPNWKNGDPSLERDEPVLSIRCQAPGPADNYRSRVYNAYVTARNQNLAPRTIEGFRPRSAQLNKLIRLHFPPNRDAAILDLGCGHGALVHFARAAGYRNIRGVDRSAQQIEAAQQLGIEGVYGGDLVETLLSMADSSLDAVVTFDVIEHFRKDELIGFVDEVLRVIRAEGKWIIHVPNGESPFGPRMRYWDFTHEVAFTRESITQLLLSSGFTTVRCYEDAPVPHGMKSGVRWLLWKGMRAGIRAWLAVETGDSAREGIFTQNLFAVGEK